MGAGRQRLTQLTTGGHGDTDPAFTDYQGSSSGGVLFIRDGQPYEVGDDGSAPSTVSDRAGPPCGDGNTDYVDFVPWDGPGSLAVAQRTAGLYIYPTDCVGIVPTVDVPGGSDPDWSSDGTGLAYVAPDAGGVNQVFTAPYSNGLGTATQITHETSDVSSPRWSADGTQIEYTVGGEIKVVNASSGATVSTIQDAEDGAWQPVTQGTVNRIYGADAIGAALAESQYGFADAGDTAGPKLSATAVVLARSDEYYDAIAGAAFARDIRAPLLVTDPTGLDPAVLAEIQRVLGGGGTVYLLGGTSSLSTDVQNSLTGAGFTADRIAGTDLFDTAALVDQAIGSHFDPDSDEISRVLLASGASYDDCLVASSAAGSNFTTNTAIVLTDGSTMPAASAAYLNTLNPATVQYITVGGPAAQALASANLTWGPVTPAAALSGTNAIDTSVLAAEYFDGWASGFGQAGEVKVTGEWSWADALTAGSLGTQGNSPLLLTSPSEGLTPEVQDYLQQESASIDTVDDLASPSDLAASYDTQLGDAVGLPGQYSVVNLYSSE